MPAELRELVHATSPQGRVELFPAPADHPGTVEGLTVLDARWSYWP